MAGLQDRWLTVERRNWILFFVLGTINNLAYVVVLSAAQSLVQSFGALKLFGLVTWANVLFGSVARGANAFLLEGTAYRLRVGLTAAMYIVGLIGVALSNYIGFAFCLCSIVFVGAASSFGESMMLGYIRNYPADMVGGWSSGTGMAGVLGSAMYLALAAVGMTNQAIFLLLLLFVPIYCAAYALLKLPDVPPSYTAGVANGGRQGSLLKSFHSPDDTGAGGSGGLQARLLDDPCDNVESGIQACPHRQDGATSGVADADQSSYSIVCDTSRPQETMWARTLRCSRMVIWYASQLGLVYLLEYVVSTTCADAANFSCSINDQARANAYAVLAFCYQFGVLISRSSLKVVHIKRVGWLSVLQGGNLVLWLCQDLVRFLGIWVQFPLMVFVGLLGGAAYVNVFHLLLTDPKIAGADRELCINIGALFINFGIIAASVFALILDNTFLKHALVS